MTISPWEKIKQEAATLAGYWTFAVDQGVHLLGTVPSALSALEEPAAFAAHPLVHAVVQPIQGVFKEVNEMNKWSKKLGKYGRYVVPTVAATYAGYKALGVVYPEGKRKIDRMVNDTERRVRRRLR